MKIKITDSMKKFITVAEMPVVKNVIACVKEDESKVEDYALIAARVALNTNCVEVLQASAEIARNRRVWNQYTNDSADFDVWIRFVAYNEDDCFVMCGVYLTDVLSITGDNHAVIRSVMHIREFKEVTNS